MPKKRKRNKKAVTRQRVNDAKLLFSNSDGLSGISPLSLSIKEPPAVVREIIQNSLDAANDAGRECAEVDFQVERISMSSIPGIREYRTAIEKVSEYQESLGWPDQAKETIDSINCQLNMSEVPVMFVSDNGVGLDKKLMNGMLGDGITCKGHTQSLGSHGNGHYSTFALSELRYILYAGVSVKNGHIASGHAILGSHEGDNRKRKGKDGYLIKQFNETGIEEPYVFPNDPKEIPPILKHKLDEIQLRWNTGTVLGIVGFNSFSIENSTPESVAELILAVSSLNFFIAIQRGQLKVSVKIGSLRRTVSSDNVKDLLATNVKEAEITKFPKYVWANNFLDVFLDGEMKEISTGAGTLNLHYQQSTTQSTSIALCRSGMWITKDVPSVKKTDFINHVPFTALILADPSKGNDISLLVRHAEGNLHNSLNLNHVKDRDKKAKLRLAFQEVKNRLRDLIDECDNDYVDFVDLDTIGPVPETFSKPIGGSIEPVVPPSGPIGPKPTPPLPGPGPEPRPKPEPRPEPRPGPKPGSSVPANVLIVRNGTNQLQLRIVPRSSSPEVEMSLHINGGADITCDSPTEGSSHLHLTKVVCDDEDCVVDRNGTVRIGSFSESKEKSIKAWYENPNLSGDFRIDCQLTKRSRRT